MTTVPESVAPTAKVRGAEEGVTDQFPATVVSMTMFSTRFPLLVME